MAAQRHREDTGQGSPLESRWHHRPGRQDRDGLQSHLLVGLEG